MQIDHLVSKITDLQARNRRQNDLLARAVVLLMTFSALRCSGGTANEWVSAIEASDTLAADVESLSNAG